MSITRFSSRTERLDTEFLAKALKGADKYYRIAGYFRSSVFELVGEQIAQIPEVKIICNSEIDPNDFLTASLRETSIKARWNEIDIETDSVLRRDSYQILDRLLTAGNVEIRLVPKDRLFLHGKAGSIHYADGSRKSFVGSVNESKSAFVNNYELVWQDDDPESADWVEEEFFSLWKDGIPLPNAILEEIHRAANRREVKPNELFVQETAPAAIIESPIYRGGEQLQPWQRSFVSMFMEHREIYGKARLLLADEVGLGKTLSMAAAALVSIVSGDGAVLILAPATLVFQWQTELQDKLGIPALVWMTQMKAWAAPDGRIISQKGDINGISACPYQIGIVSTGLIMHQYENGAFRNESEKLLSRRYGTVILDEAHKARLRGGVGSSRNAPNNLLRFMKQIGEKAKNIILGTATPIQTNISDLWNLLQILNSKVNFVLGNADSQWQNYDKAVPLITGKTQPENKEEVWEWLSNPLPPHNEIFPIEAIHRSLLTARHEFICHRSFEELDEVNVLIKMNYLAECLRENFFRDCNPVLRHVVLRKRSDLEEKKLLEKIGVANHPDKNQNHLYQSRFDGVGLSANTPFDTAYEHAERFCSILSRRTSAGGFIKTLMLQRICSSFTAGLKTAQNILGNSSLDFYEEDGEKTHTETIFSEMSDAEVDCLNEIITQLSRPEAVDPKLATVKWFLTSFRTEGRTWLEHGCIIFSQYYNTAEWIAQELAKVFPDMPAALYAGAEKSKIFRGSLSSSVKREAIKKAVKEREIKLVIATDAACEGLNLQTLGTLINIDLPWNPSRLEQRLGRIKRIGQARPVVDMLNLVYKDTQDEKIYKVLSDRMKDIYNIFGSLPDTIEDEWIENEEELKKRIDTYIHEREAAQNAFSVKYCQTILPDNDDWNKCNKVLSRNDILEMVSKQWGL